ncbi:hypothetical protein KI102_002629 [Enterococcus hirae]|nr:hypothetical protein [Enterococcus hirae]
MNESTINIPDKLQKENEHNGVTPYLTRGSLDEHKLRGFITLNLPNKFEREGYLALIKQYSDGHCEFRLYNETRSPNLTKNETAKNNINLKLSREELDELIDELEELQKFEYLPSMQEELERAYRERKRLEQAIKRSEIKLTSEVKKAMKMLIDTGQARNKEHAFNIYEGRIRTMNKTKRHVMDLALNNRFTYFVTFTFAHSPDKKNEYGLEDEYRFDLMYKWLRKMVRKHGKFNYIVVPERHKSGEIHFHMLADLPSTVELVQGTNAKTGKPMIRKGYKVYNLPEWEYGFTDVETIRSNNGVARYVTKYFTKDLALSPVRCGKKKYWQSSGLKAPERIYLTPTEIEGLIIKGQLVLPEASYQNEKMSIYDLDEFLLKD